MTASKMHALVGKRASLMLRPGSSAYVTIREVRQAYGRVRADVEPLAGFGLSTVDLDSLSISDATGLPCPACNHV